MARPRQGARARGIAASVGARSTLAPHNKNRDGCVTCKARKVKCDETKPPPCNNCRKAHRECGGYHPPLTKLFEPWLKTTAQKNSLQFFKEKTVHCLASYRALGLSSGFWQTVVPKLAEDFVPVRAAMLALAAQHEIFEKEVAAHFEENADTNTALPTLTTLGLEWTGNALIGLKTSLSEHKIPSEVALLSCLLLHLYSIWTIAKPMSFDHVFGGLKLCRQLRSSPKGVLLYGGISLNIDTMLAAFQHSADYANILLETTDQTQSALLREFCEAPRPSIPVLFADIEDATACVDKVLRLVVKTRAAIVRDDRVNLENDLDSLGSGLQASRARSLDMDDKVSADRFRVLLVHRKAAKILLIGLASQTELIYDDHLEGFKSIVTEMEELVASKADSMTSIDFQARAQIGTIPPLFLAATKCRHPIVRQRAVQAIRRISSQEYLWTSCLAARIAERVAHLENWYRYDGDGSSQRLDSARARLVGIKFDVTNQSVHLDCQVFGQQAAEVTDLSLQWTPPSSAANEAGPFVMPTNMVRACGYPSLMLACGPTRDTC